jgi:hypothetical protein
MTRRPTRALLGWFSLLVVALFLGSEAPPAPPVAPPLVGFSYSPVLSRWANRDPASDLASLLATTQPDLVRLPVYWDETQPTPDSLDYSSIDSLLAAVTAHDRTSSRQTRVILTIGARNFLYPELHAPAWAGQRLQPELGYAQEGTAYRTYFEATLVRYRSSPLLYAWQVENEPFDFVVNETTGDDQISPAQIQWEIREVHGLDPSHRAVTTTYDGWNVMIDWLQLNATGVLAALNGYPSGHPGEALSAGDALGLDIYVDGPSTPLRFASVALRTSWKVEAIRFWSGVAKAENKEVWLTEMQAQPWGSASDRFSIGDLLATAAAYRQDPLQVVLLWGVETWLKDPSWMKASVSAMEILRTP